MTVEPLSSARRRPLRRSQSKYVNRPSKQSSTPVQSLTTSDMASLIVRLLERKQLDNNDKQASMRLTEIGSKILPLTGQSYGKAKFGQLTQFLMQQEYQNMFLVRSQRVFLSSSFDPSSFTHTELATSIFIQPNITKPVKRSLVGSLDKSSSSLSLSTASRRSWKWYLFIAFIAVASLLCLYNYRQHRSRNAQMTQYLELLDKQATLLQLELDAMMNSQETG